MQWFDSTGGNTVVDEGTGTLTVYGYSTVRTMTTPATEEKKDLSLKMKGREIGYLENGTLYLEKGISMEDAALAFWVAVGSWTDSHMAQELLETRGRIREIVDECDRCTENSYCIQCKKLLNVIETDAVYFFDGNPRHTPVVILDSPEEAPRSENKEEAHD